MTYQTLQNAKQQPVLQHVQGDNPGNGDLSKEEWSISHPLQLCTEHIHLCGVSLQLNSSVWVFQGPNASIVLTDLAKQKKGRSITNIIICYNLMEIHVQSAVSLLLPLTASKTYSL